MAINIIQGGGVYENLNQAKDLMQMKGVGVDKIQQLYSPQNIKGVGEVEESGYGKFGEVLKNAVERVDEVQKSSQGEIRKVLTGESDNIHQAMIATQEANLAFTALVEVRNKLIESYQELMRMQV